MTNFFPTVSATLYNNGKSGKEKKSIGISLELGIVSIMALLFQHLYLILLLALSILGYKMIKQDDQCLPVTENRNPANTPL